MPRLVRGKFGRFSMCEGHLDVSRCTGDILPRFVREKFGRFSMYDRHLDTTRCTGDILPRLDGRGTFFRDSRYEGHLDATRCTGDMWSFYDIRWTFCRDSVYEEIWTPLDVRGHFDVTGFALISMSQISVPDCCSVWWPTLIIKHRIALRCWRFPDTQRCMIFVSLIVLSSCNRS